MRELDTPTGDDIAAAVQRFVGRSAGYYNERFVAIFRRYRQRLRPNFAAALLGPIWAAARGMFGIFVLTGLIELAAVLAIVFVSSGGLGREQVQQVAELQARSDARKAQAQEAQAKGSANWAEFLASSEAFGKAAEQARNAASTKQQMTSLFLGASVLIWLLSRAGFALWADRLYARQFERWRRKPSVRSGLSFARGGVALLLLGAVYLLSIAKICAFALPSRLASLSGALDSLSKAKDLTISVSLSLNQFFATITRVGDSVFDAITWLLTSAVNSVEAVLLQMPWTATSIIIVGLALLVAGYRTATFTALGLAYLVLFGFWEKSMATIALLGTATLLSLCIGLPLGVLCGKRVGAYRIARPVLDLMQTMPAFVYLIPIIAFFGTGKTPGILATIVFGMPPAARLTALGLQQVPDSIREACIAFGATPWQVLVKAEIPLAMPSIMAGINQTILLCLSMVVITSLIGAGGLGEDVLEALQYASVGQGILVGLAILFCAIILDRIVQGRQTA